MGFGLGTALLKLGWVDCENWDLYAVIGHHEGRPKGSSRQGQGARRPSQGEGRRKKAAEAATTSPEDRAAAATGGSRRTWKPGSVAEAYASYDRSVRTIAGWMPPDAEWLALIQALLRGPGLAGRRDRDGGLPPPEPQALRPGSASGSPRSWSRSSSARPTP